LGGSPQPPTRWEGTLGPAGLGVGSKTKTPTLNLTLTSQANPNLASGQPWPLASGGCAPETVPPLSTLVSTRGRKR